MRVPEQLQRAMAAEAEAAREARAKVIAAEGEHKASRALRHAAEVIMDSPAALQVVFYILTQSRPDHYQFSLDASFVAPENSQFVFLPTKKYTYILTYIVQ